MVRPVELQDVFSKTQAAERITQLQKAHPENQQQQAATETGRKNQAQQRKPVPSARTDEVILHCEKDKEKREKKKTANEDADDEKETAQSAADEEETPDGDDQPEPETPEPGIQPVFLSIRIDYNQLSTVTHRTWKKLDKTEFQFGSMDLK